MVKEKRAPEREAEPGRVVYSRAPTTEGGSAMGGGSPPLVERGSVAPLLLPLLVGFILLVGLVFGLGRLSVQQLRAVSGHLQELEQQQSDKTELLLNLRNALFNLNNEARARQDAMARGGIVIPFDLKLRNARGEVNKLLPTFDHLPLTQTPPGAAFRNALNEYLKSSEDVKSYSLQGFPQFRDLDAQLRVFLDQANEEQRDLSRQRLVLEEQAAEQITTLTFFAVLTGAIIAAVTIWEVQRRFRQVRRSLDETRRERQFSSQMLEGMVSAIVAIDARDHIRSANATFFKLFPDASVGASIYDPNVATREELKVFAAATATRVEQSTYRGRWMLRGAGDAAERAFDVYSSPLDIDGERGQIITLVDVTEAAEAEAELRHKQSLAAVGQATAQVAHEIKNPLGSIRLGVAMLRDMTQDAEAHSTIDLVERGINHLNQLTVDVTQFSRDRQLAPAPADVNELLDTSLELITDRVQEKQASVEKHYSREPLVGDLDVDQMRQVFVNVLANAVEASAEKSPIIITTERVSNNARGGNGRQSLRAPYARVTITDRGKGMDEQTRARIFEPFFSTKKRGTGLGLAIVKKIIEQHQGAIHVESASGKGTSFQIELPLKSQE